MHHILGMRTNAPEDAEHALHKQWRLHQAAVDEVSKRIEMAYVVTLDLEPRAVVSAGCQDFSMSAKVFLKIRSFDPSR